MSGPPSSSLTGTRPRERLRRDATPRRTIAEINGLRGLALTLVVLFHLFGAGRVSGGVDVFLFVSGFLLALSLASSVDAGEGVALRRRWGRIFTRLTPAACCVLLFVVVLTLTILPPWFRDQNLHEVVASALYVENWELIRSQLAYGAAGPLASPVQHFWSLAIQAQFFVVVPVLFALVALATRARRVLPVAWGILAAATAASFVYATVVNATDPDAAYFDSFARFWELGAGALLAAVVRRGLPLPRVVAGIGAALGLVLIVSSGFLVDGARAFPGPWALVPVGGAALVVLASGANGAHLPAALLRTRPLRLLDRYAYGLYLWHWPLLIGLLAVTTAESASIGLAVVVLVLSGAAAWMTRAFVSEPLERLTKREGRGTGLIPVVAVGAVVILSLSLQALPGTGGGSATFATRDPCRGAASFDPALPHCAETEFDEVLPAPAELAADDENRDECWSSSASPGLFVCSLGPRTGYTRHLLAVGDSHNNALIGAYEAIAAEYGWRIDVAGRGRCFWSRAAQWQPNAEDDAECIGWNAAVSRLVARSSELDAVVVTHSSVARIDVPDGQDGLAYRIAGLQEAWAERPAGVPVIAVRDNPIFPVSMLACVTDFPAGPASGCALPRDEALHDDGLVAAAQRTPGAHLVDMSDYACARDQCEIVAGGVAVVRDGKHLTATFARTLAPYLGAALAAIVDPRAR